MTGTAKLLMLRGHTEPRNFAESRERYGNALWNDYGGGTAHEVGTQYGMTGRELGDVWTDRDARFPKQNEEEHRTSSVEHGRTESNMPHSLDKETAEAWMSKLHNEDGSMGAHWTMDQTKQVMAQKHMELDPIEFYVTMNMLYSDYCQIAKTHGVNTVDFYADMARAFLVDKDAVANKLLAYYEYVAK